MSRPDGAQPRTPIVTLHAHVKELRRRLFFVAGVFIVFASLAYNVRDQLLHFLMSPLAGQKLIFTNPTGGFSFVFRVALWAGFMASFPVIIYNIYRFIAPALPKKAQSQTPLILCGSCILFAIGAAFGYVYAIPGALHFLLGFANGYAQAMLTADSYVHFVIMYTVGLGLLFQVPVLMLIIHWIKPLKPGGLLKFERYVILLAFIIGALISPSPDVMSQTIIALPFIGMYQLGFVAILISSWRTKREKRRQAQAVEVVPAIVAPAIIRTAPVVAQQIAAPVKKMPAVATKQVATGRSIDGFRTSSATPSRPAIDRHVLTPPTPRSTIRPVGRRQVMDGCFTPRQYDA